MSERVGPGSGTLMWISLMLTDNSWQVSIATEENWQKHFHPCDHSPVDRILSINLDPPATHQDCCPTPTLPGKELYFFLPLKKKSKKTNYF